jgi:isoleucyl-tRNA synthetase
MLAPVLAFTADEAWEFVPGKTLESAHRLTWQAMGFEMPEAERTVWKTLFELRELGLPVLEQARQAKEIGKALEAKLTLTGAAPALSEAKAHSETLRELLNVSELEIKLEGGATVTVSVSKAAGEKCERCWHWEATIGDHAEHPTLCARCVEAVAQTHS